ncbi:hypothetical protein CQW23_13922 [Capsicum baccatum]|uniref:Uncharacterized protein n=1 Tax=Capsicum baccatum TaxID=33114 RepID=A0A2G2WHQ3_CAPBA|nr:hypothetical protein CQW23_13922 [Capsicum baccatum]
MDVVNVLDFMESLKNEEDQNAVEVADQIEKVKMVLAFICTYVQLSYSDLEKFEVVMTDQRLRVEELLQSIICDAEPNMGIKHDVHHSLPCLMDNIDDCISSCRYSKSSATMTDKQLDFLLLNLHHLSKYLAEQIYPLEMQFEILQNFFVNIRNFHGLIVNGYVEHEIVEYVLPQFQAMTERVGRFMWDSHIDGNSFHLKLPHLFLKIIPIELTVMHICYTNLKDSPSAEIGCFIQQLLETSPDILKEYMIHLQEHTVTVITASISGARNIHVMIEFLLIILTDMPKDMIHRGKLFDLLARVGALIREVSTLVHDLEGKSMNEESTNGTNRATLDLLENIELLKEDLKHSYLRAPDSSQCFFPMSDGPLFMHLLLRHLNDLLDSNAYSIALIKEETGVVKEDLEFIRSFFVNIDQGLYKDLWAHVLDVAFEAKDVIDSIIVRDNGLLHLIFSLPNTINKIKLIKEEVSVLHEMIPKNRSLTVVNSTKKPVERKSLTTGKVIVGFKEETDWLIRKLTNGPANLDVISIFGMPGSGKTTLAYKVYNDKSVCSHFDLRAWCTVYQEYDEKTLLVKLFNQVTGSDLKFGVDVADMLRKQLFGKRYLIVLDDVWDIDAWDGLTRPFPEAKKRSRIILTTRQKEVAFHAKGNTDPLNLRLLSPEESWELLEKRAFGNDSCPDELLEVGREIARNCKGLPLVADLIAGVIVGREKTKTAWLEIRNNLNSFILNSEVEVMKVIELSYDRLPNHLKPCLLDLATLRKDTAIIINVLKAYWRAEGFVEEVMEVYLDNLISSSLVIIYNEIGHHSTCRIHDLVHDFCSIKARKEKFYDLISSNSPSSSSDLLPWKITMTQHFGLNNFFLFGSKKKRHSGKHLYSLVIIGHKLDYSLSDICHLRHLRLLRVLQLDPSFIMVKDSLLNEICMLNHLRYLQFGTKVKSLPSSFSNLSNLETLWVINEGSALVLLPRIWHLVKLQVLLATACSFFFFDIDTDEPILITHDSKLENMRILQKLVISYSKDTEEIFKRFPNLQELSFILKDSWNYTTEQNWFPKLDFLTELKVLNVELERSNTNWSWNFHFPSNLKILRLRDFHLTSDSLSTIGRLHYLEELTLIRPINQGEEWNMGEEDTFQKLKYLRLEELTLAKWEIGGEFFPVLEKLELWRCHKLEEIPSSFGDIYSLKSIRLVESPQLEDSALKIKQDVEEMTGEDKLQILGLNNMPLCDLAAMQGYREGTQMS